MTKPPTSPARDGGSDEESPSARARPDEDLGYEEARQELLEVVRTLEQGGTTLEESLALWERGERLARICQAWLDGARARLEAVVSGGDDPTADG